VRVHNCECMIQNVNTETSKRVPD